MRGQFGDPFIKAGEPKSNSLKKLNWTKPTLQTELEDMTFMGTAKFKQTHMGVGQI